MDFWCARGVRQKWLGKKGGLDISKHGGERIWFERSNFEFDNAPAMQAMVSIFLTLKRQYRSIRSTSFDLLPKPRKRTLEILTPVAHPDSPDIWSFQLVEDISIFHADVAGVIDSPSSRFNQPWHGLAAHVRRDADDKFEDLCAELVSARQIF